MGERLRRLIPLAAGFGLLAGLSYGLYAIAKSALAVLRSLESDIAVAIIAAAATALVSVLSIVVGRIVEGRAKIAEQNREKKIPVYEDLIHFMMRIVVGSKTGTEPDEAEIIRFMTEFTQRLMVWGSDEVLACWVQFRKHSVSEGGKDPFRLMMLYEDTVKQIRRDLGHKNAGIARGDILSLFINDIEKVLPGRRSR
jgi:hypothetical protein